MHPQRRQRSSSARIPAWPVCTATTRTSSRREHTAVGGGQRAHHVASLERVWRATACRTRVVGDTRGHPVVQKVRSLRNSMFPFRSRCATSRPCRFASIGRVLPGAYRTSPRHIPRAVPPAPDRPGTPSPGRSFFGTRNTFGLAGQRARGFGKREGRPARRASARNPPMPRASFSRVSATCAGASACL